MKKLFTTFALILCMLFSSFSLFACNGLDFSGGNGSGDTDISGDTGDNGEDTPTNPDGGNGGEDTPTNPDGGNDNPSNPDDGGNGDGGNDNPTNPDTPDTPDQNEFVEKVVNGITYTPNQNNTYTVTAVVLSSTTLTIEQSVNGVDVTEIGKDAARGKSTILKVVLPETVKTIGENAFLGCKKIKEIDLSKVENIGKNAFNGALATTNISLDLNSLKTLGDGAFSGATYLREADMERSTLTEIPEKGFFGCSRLFTVKLPKTVTVIKKQAFMANGCLVNINLENVERFKLNCFSDCINLTSVTLTNAKEIRFEAFFQCTKLATVIIGEKLEVLYTRAFYSDNAITYFEIGNTEQEWWWYHQSANAFTNDNIKGNDWSNGERWRINDPIECAEFIKVRRNDGVFICSEAWVKARGYTSGQSFPHRTHWNMEDL